jgi:two-component system cell cycle sensor histidine kinase/response regulator CckA
VTAVGHGRLKRKKTELSNTPYLNLPQGHIAIDRNIAVPIMHQDAVVGLFHVANKNTDYTAQDIELLEEIARATAPVLEARLRRDASERTQRQLLSAIEQAGDSIVITDATGDITYVNPAFVLTTGYSQEEVHGKNSRIQKTGKQDDGFYRRLWQTITSGRTWAGRMVNKRKNGTLFTEEATISPVCDPSGRIVNFVAVKHDITERLRLEAQFQQAQKMESFGRLAGGVAHDFNNMLGVISGYADLALMKVAPGQPLHAEFEEILNAACRSAAIARQLLAFARKQTISPKVLDLNERVENTLNMLHQLIGEDIDLAWMPESGLWPVKMDPTQIGQILANLCVNARDAISGAGKLTIATGNVALDAAYCPDLPGFIPGEFVLLSVSGDGCGMDKAILDHLFEPIFTTKEMGRGTGLGLATVYGIVKQNDEFINVCSEFGKGTSFTIYLPRHAGQTEETRVVRTEEIARPRGETLLVVEDEPAILKTAQLMLEKLGYRVLPAATAGEAMQLAESHSGQIDLLITDVVMPEMNGQQLAKKLKDAFPKLEVLFMSGYTADAIAHRGVIEKDMHFLEKPFSLKDLASKVRTALY